MKYDIKEVSSRLRATRESLEISTKDMAEVAKISEQEYIAYETGDPVAANSIASMVQQLCTVAIFGVANSAAVIIP